MEIKQRHIFWDWNGTLLDDVNLCLQLTNREFKRHNIPAVSMEVYRSKIGHPVKNFYASHGLELNDQEFEELACRFLEWYKAELSSCSLQVDVANLIRLFSSKQCKQYILSAHHHQSLQEAISHFGLAEHFQSIRGLEAKTADSKVELAHALLASIDCTPDQVLLIGDTDHDAQVASALGIECVLVAHGYQPRSRLEGLGYRVIDKLAELNA